MKLARFIENDNNSNYLVFKSPITEILNKSTLVVNESEVAIFVRDGQIVNTFTYGRYELTTNKYPLLIKIQKKFVDDVSSVSVYFIRLVDILNLEWGTDSPIQIIDRKYGFSVSLRAFGIYSFKINNPQKVLVKMIGLDTKTVSIKTFDKIFKRVFISHIKNEISVYMKENNLSVMDMNTEYFNIADKIKEELNLVCVEYGLELLNFQINSISIPEDDPNYKQINDAITKQNIYVMQGSSFKDIAKKEVEMEMASHSNLQTFINVGKNDVNKANQLVGICVKCGFKLSDGMAFCPLCGTAITKQRFCIYCGEKTIEGAKFCPSCGKEIK